VQRSQSNVHGRLVVLGGVVLGAVLGSGVFAAPVHARQVVRPDMGAIGQIFAKWTTATPGCAVGASNGGKVILDTAYGMADLEHNVPNTNETIFEAGSVSKQFTAAAVALLARDGKLSLEDPVRRYIPELPDYGAPLTIRHMLQHMSGLRDWGSVESIAGWPRGTRVYTHAHVLDIVSRQTALNFTPGSQYSYSNTGYNLAAIIVTRVSGVPFAEFSQQRIFKPLGMTHTSWRDDFRRVVKNRAIAYEQTGRGFSQDMPFENIHGNGGLLTTVSDLLKWNEHFVTPVIGDAAFVTMQQTPGLFNDGKPGNYALGLTVGMYRGLREIGHSGSTAGYRAHLLRYPEKGLSVAVLCNVSTGTATQYAHAVAEALMPDAFQPVRPAAAPAPAAPPNIQRPSADQLKALEGTYVSDDAETTLVAVVVDGVLALKRRPDTVMRLVATAQMDVFTTPQLGTVTFRRDAAGKVTALSVKQERVWDLRFERR
ncbi:MAG: beta-lactamase family protein, partial [Acidobacteria bacterium]|nr:beta-lactamase family protein [Acidobacteriota bacterium]